MPPRLIHRATSLELRAGDTVQTFRGNRVRLFAHSGDRVYVRHLDPRGEPVGELLEWFPTQICAVVVAAHVTA